MTTSVVLLSPQGARLAELPFLSLTYTLSVAQVGSLTVSVPPAAVPDYGRDYQIEVWRNVNGGPLYLEGGKRWFVRKVTRTIAAAETLTLQAVCCNDLLRRRIVAYDAGSAFTSKTGAADDVLKAIVRENFTGSMTAARDVTGQANISATFAVAGSTTQGAAISVACTRDNVLETARKICEASITAGVYLAFDVAWSGSAFVLQTYTAQLGADHRYPSGTNPVIFAQEFGTLSEAEIIEDYTDEATVVIAGAQGIADTRTIATSTDAVRVLASPYNHCEVFYQGNGAGYDSTVLTDMADGRLRAGRPARTITGVASETPAVRYGRDWSWGDRVTVQVDGKQANARIDTVTVSVQGGKETIDGGIRIDD